MQPYSERQNHARRKGILRNKENVGNNHLHGGKCGFDKKPFEIVEQTKNSITFKYVSKDGEEGYPGELALTVKYTLKESELLIEYTATTDKTTLWCPTNHTYFNLDGESSGDCLDNVLQINSERITLMNDELITTGEVKYVHNTPYDFTMSKRIGRDIYSAELDVTKGYDSNYILSEPTLLDDGQSKTEEESKDPLYPLNKQTKELQKKNQHAIVVAHLGDFYEVIGEKAKAVSEEFSLILKYRDNPTRKWCIYTIK